MNAIQPPGLPDALLEIAEYTLDASKVVFGSENYPVACELAWGSAENAVKAAMFHRADDEEVPMLAQQPNSFYSVSGRVSSLLPRSCREKLSSSVQPCLLEWVI